MVIMIDPPRTCSAKSFSALMVHFRRRGDSPEVDSIITRALRYCFTILGSAIGLLLLPRASDLNGLACADPVGLLVEAALDGRPGVVLVGELLTEVRVALLPLQRAVLQERLEHLDPTGPVGDPRLVGAQTLLLESVQVVQVTLLDLVERHVGGVILQGVPRGCDVGRRRL